MGDFFRLEDLPERVNVIALRNPGQRDNPKRPAWRLWFPPPVPKGQEGDWMPVGGMWTKKTKKGDPMYSVAIDLVALLRAMELFAAEDEPDEPPSDDIPF